MKKINRIKLTEFSRNEITAKEQQILKGGEQCACVSACIQESCACFENNNDFALAETSMNSYGSILTDLEGTAAYVVNKGF